MRTFKETLDIHHLGVTLATNDEIEISHADRGYLTGCVCGFSTCLSGPDCLRARSLNKHCPGWQVHLTRIGAPHKTIGRLCPPLINKIKHTSCVSINKITEIL